MSAWQTTARRLIRRIDPEGVGSRPIYLVDAGELPKRWPFHKDDCWGFTSPILDLHCQRHLERKGEWSGRGFAAVVYVKRIHRESHEPWRECVQVVLHEFAHHLDANPNLLKPVNEWPAIIRDMGNPDWQPKRVAKWDDSVRMVNNHGPGFVRSCIHIAERANALGFACDAVSIGGQNCCESVESEHAEKLKR